MTESELRANATARAPAGCAESVAVLAILAERDKLKSLAHEWWRAATDLENASDDDQEAAARRDLHELKIGNAWSDVPVPVQKAIADTRDAALKRVNDLELELAKLKGAIAKHHSQKADDRCWMDDDGIYAAAGLPLADVRVGDRNAMLANCQRFIDHRCDSGGPWKSYAELEAECAKLHVEHDPIRGALYHLLGEVFQSESVPDPTPENAMLAEDHLERERERTQAEIARLKDELDAAKSRGDYLAAVMDTPAEQRAAEARSSMVASLQQAVQLRGQVVDLREALKPFADLAARFCSVPNDYHISTQIVSLRRATKVLEETASERPATG